MKLYGGSGRRESGKKQGKSYRSGSSGADDRTNEGHENRGDKGDGRKQTPPKKKRAGKIVLSIFLVLFALFAAAFAYWKITTRPPETQPESPDLEAGPDDPFDLERYYTMMIVGDDQEGGNTDTLMVMRFDTQEMTANVVSIPRDTVLNIPLQNKKINAVYHNLGGMDALLDEIERITGFRPNNYMMVDMDVFIDVVDALGGVDFDVPLDMDYDDWSDHDDDGVFEYEFHIHLQKGQQSLTGYEALGVFRFRMNNDGSGYEMGDIQRLSVQHNLLMAIAAKAMSTKNVVTLYNIASSVLDKCETDLSLGNVQWYIQEFMKMSLENISFHTAPTSGCEVLKSSYVTLNADEWVEMVNQKLIPFAKTVTKEDLAIFNHTGGELDYRGFLIVEPKSFFCTNGEEALNTNFYKKS